MNITALRLAPPAYAADDGFPAASRDALSMNERVFLRVAVALPVTGTYSYAVSDSLEPLSGPGCRVMVPFGRRRVTGFILERLHGGGPGDLKEIEEVLDAEPLFPPSMVSFFEWMAGYYMHPVGQVIQSALPWGLNMNPVKTAALTDEGRRVIRLQKLDPEEKRMLLWFDEHPGRRLPFPLQPVLKLKGKGWLVIRERARTGAERARPLMRKFVRAARGMSPEAVLDAKGQDAGARNEDRFLRMIFHSGPALLKDVASEFENGGYLVRKWVGRGVLECFPGPVYRNPEGSLIVPSPVPEFLFPQQAEVLDRIRQCMDRRAFSPCLLYGVTGSGKTEVYFRAVEHALRLGRQVLLMVPEISLAAYMAGLFQSRLGDRLAVYHSGLGRGERYDQWMRIARGEADVVIGARSAVFAPLPRLGLIVVDEEHDGSYKQEMSPRYQARDLAVMRAKMEGIVVVLGSGTPAVQSFHNGLEGRYQLLSMPERVERRPLPDVTVIDMKTLDKRPGERAILSPALEEAIARTLSEGRQIILFLNRRGFHRVFLCAACGQVVRCPNCEVALTHHLKEEDRLLCHFCGFASAARISCSSCGAGSLKAYGFGTERLEDELNMRFPEARIARMDTDSTRRKGQAAGILRKFGEGTLDILLGTQMITKGFDFPRVTLVGVIAADLSLGFPDFRAGERTFQLLSQVAGRSGRGEDPGRVIVQTFNPGHYAIRTAVTHDYRGFFDMELRLREQLGYPPFAHLVCLRLKGNSSEKTADAAQCVGSALRGILAGWPKRGKEIQVLGPVEAPIAKIKGKYRWHLLLKSRSISLLRHLVQTARERSKAQLRPAGVQLTVDVDPYQMT